MKPEQQPEAEPELQVKAEPELQVKAEPELQVKAEPELQVKAEPDLQVKAEPDLQVKAEPDLQVKAEPEQQSEEEPAATPVPNFVRLFTAPIEDKPLVAVEEKREEQQIALTPISVNLMFVAPPASTSIRNEPIAAERAAPKSAVVGLPYSSEERPGSTYSPFDIKSRPVEFQTLEPTVPPPPPVRQRFQWPPAQRQ